MDGDDEDGWEDALGYLDACGPGVHLQIGRMSSDKQSGSLVSTSSGGFGILLDESQRDHVCPCTIALLLSVLNACTNVCTNFCLFTVNKSLSLIVP